MRPAPLSPPPPPAPSWPPGGRRVSLAPCERDNLIREVQWSHCLALEMSHKSHVSPVDQFEWRAECEKLLVRKFVYFTPILKPSQRERGGSGMQHDSRILYCSVYCVQYREYEYSWQVINSQLSSYQGWSGYKSFPSGGTTWNLKWQHSQSLADSSNLDL